MSRIFISHSNEDGEQSARLLAWLHDHGFVSTFLDFDEHHGIGPGADWERTLYRELSGADAVILILTRNWFGSKWCFAEFAQARALGKTIYPLIESPSGETFVSSDIQHLDLIKDREGGMQRLLSELTRIALDTHGGYEWDPTRPPYPGLLAFDEADAAIYFGRDDDMRRLIERLNARRAQGGEKLVLVQGASGSGKSSLLRAGVVPRLKRDPHNWIVLPPFRPQLFPLDELAQVVATGLGQATEWRRWRDALAGGDFTHSLFDLARDLRAAHKQAQAHILLVIDQGEELFTASEPEQAEKFFRALNALLDERLPFLAVMSLRSDYVGRLQQEPHFAASFEQFFLKPMPLERVREIIEGPARIAGIAVDEGMVTAAMADARTEDALPLLAFALRELYDRFANSGRLTAEAYRALGDAQAQLSPLENAVRRKADEVLAAARPAPEDLDALREAFIPAMVRVNPEGEYVRRPAPIESLSPRALPLIERLARARLLTILEELGVRTVEVAHEALLRKWPLLRGWLDEEREFLVGTAQLEQDLLDWDRAAPEQKSDALLTGLKLTRARIWLVAKPNQLTAREREFIQASIARQEAETAQRERARRRVLRGTIAAAAVLAMVAVAALWEWRQASVERSQAVSRQLASQSVQDSATDLGAALRDAVSAAQMAHTDEAEIALNAVLTGPHERFILDHQSTVTSARISPDGKRIVTASADGTSRVWDAGDGRLLLTLGTLRLAAVVLSAAFSPDGQRIVTANQDGTAQVWDAGNGHLLATLAGHTNLVWSALFSPDGKRIVTASFDHTARVWDAGTGHLLATLTGHTDAVFSAVFSPDSSRIVTASADKTARVWNAADGHLLAALTGHTDKVVSAVFSPDGSRIVTASWDNTARVWDAGSGHLLATLNGHTDYVISAVFSPDGRRIATAGHDGSARVWDAQTGRPLFALAGHTGNVVSVVFSPDGKRIVTGSWDKTARVWDAEDGNLLSILAGHGGELTSAVFTPDGSHVLTASFDHSARLWDADGSDGRLVATATGHTGALNSAAFSPDGKRVVTASADNTARVWDAQDGGLLATLTGHTGPLCSAAFSPDGQRIVTASQDGTARVWSAADGRLLATLTGHAGPVNTAIFSPDGKLIVTASSDKTARVWDSSDGRLLTTLAGHSDRINTAAFSPDGKRIVTASWDKTARVWDAQDGHLLATLTGHTDKVVSAVFSPNGERIVTASADWEAREWNASDGRPLFEFYGHTKPINSAEFSPDGQRIVTASQDGTARVWDAVNGWLISILTRFSTYSDKQVMDRPLATLTGHTGAVNSAVFSPDGTRIVTASSDKTARVWDAQDGRLLSTLTGHTAAVDPAIFSPDGTRVVTASQDGTARIFVVDFDQLLARARQLLPVESGNSRN
jgi:WD40 repeat protein